LAAREKYAKVGRFKVQYDPENLFWMNYNMTPPSRNKNG